MGKINIGKIKLVLSHPLFTKLLLLVLFISRTIQLAFLFDIRSDRLYQIMATQNLINDRGISISWVSSTDISAIIYEPLIKWPPLYSLIIAPLYSLFNKNFILSGLIVDVFFAIFLILISRKILKILDLPVYLINTFSILTGFTLYPFYTKPSTDPIAATVFVFAIYLVVWYFKSKKKSKLLITGIATSLLFCGFTKYMYMPVIFVIPVFFIIRGIIDKHILLKKYGILIFIVLLAGIMSLLLYQKTNSGFAFYITQPVRGFFPENLYLLYPFIPAAFLNPETTELILNRSTFLNSIVFIIFQWINFLGLISFLTWGSLSLYKTRLKASSIQNIFFQLVFLITLGITLLLIFLSLRVEKESGYWSYVQEPRYFALVIILLQLALFVFYNSYKKRSRLIKFGLLLAVIFMLPDMVRGMLFTTKRITFFQKEQTTWQIELKFQQFADDIIQQQQKNEPIHKVVMAGSSPYMNKRISLYSNIPMMIETDDLNNFKKIKSKEPVLLLVVIRNDALHGFSSFLKNEEKKDWGQYQGFHFFTTIVKPNQ